MTTIEQVITVVRALASQYPEAVYRAANGVCHYARGHVEHGPKEEGCIFGQAFRRLGVLDGLPAEEMGIGDAIDLLGLACTSVQGGWCELCQEAQDSSKTWSQSVEIADNQYPLTPDTGAANGNN